MEKVRKSVITAAAFAAGLLWSVQPAAAQTAEEPIITFRTNIYDTYGAANSFHIVLGATEKDYFDVDCGFGTVEVEVDVAKFDTSTSAITATSVPLVVSEEGIVKIYGDASKIDYLDCEGCYIDWIDMDKCTNLEILDMSHNELKRLDLTPFSKLQAIYLSDNPFTAETPVVVGPNKPNLSILELDMLGYIDESFNLSDYPAMVAFDGYYSKCLTKIDPTGCPDLQVLSLEMTSVESLDISNNPKLMRLNISETRIKDIDISKAPLLQNLLAEHVSGWVNTDVKLTSIDLTQNPNLVIVQLGGNRLESIDLTANKYVQTLGLSNNLLKTLDLSGNPNLYSVNLANNLFTFATLPLPEDSWGEYYYYRTPLACAKSYEVGKEIDFAADVLRAGTETSARVWKKSLKDGASLIDEADYTYADGKVTINSVFTDSLYVEFGNTAFPEYTLSTAPFMVKSAEDFGKPSNIISITANTAMAGKEISFSVGMDNASADEPKVFFVDLGDGELKEYTATSIELPAEANFTATLPSPLAGTINVYVPENDVITAFGISDVNSRSISLTAATELRWLKINNCNITTIDLANNRCLQTLDLSGNRLSNVTLAGVKGDYEKYALREINASNNYLSNFTIVATQQLEKLNLSNNRFTTYDFKNFDGLKSLDMSNNRLTEVENVPYLAAAEEVDFSNNQLVSLTVDAMPELRKFDVSNNALTLATLPDPATLPAGALIYAPQQVLQISEFAPGVNLTAQNRVINGVGTTFIWKKADGTLLQEGVDYTCDGGATRFKNIEVGKVFCEMTNPAFPELSGANVFKTSEVTPTDAPTTVIASFTTTEDSNSGEVIFTGTKTSDVYIDWRGDGTEYIQYPINGSSYTAYPEQTTYAGADVKVYTYESASDIRMFSIYNVAMSRMDASPLTNVMVFSVGGAGLDENSLVFPATDGLEEITLNDNNFSTKDFKEYPKLRNLTLSGNKYESFDASGLSSVETLVMSRNGLKEFKFGGNANLWGLDLGENNLSDISFEGAPVLSQIVLHHNNFSTIDLSPIKDVLIALDVQCNNFDFATLPLRSQFPHMGVYLFVGQSNLDVACVDGKVDLSSQASVDGVETTFRWFFGDVTIDEETGELVGEELETGGDDPEYTVENGVTTFHYDFDKVTGVLTNDAYSGLILYTNPIAIEIAGVENVVADGVDANAPVDVFTVSGIKVRSQVARSEAVKGLTPGFYIVGREKVLVK